MAEIEITLPTVQYGNVKVRATPEELGLQSVADGYDLGVAAAVYLNVFAQGFKKGASLDLNDPREPAQEAAPGNPQAAAERLADGRSPRTVDEANEMAKQVIENELGPTTEVHEVGDTVTVGGIEFTKHSEAPWDKKAEAPKPKPKPWETGW